jgi:uncharacterized protein (TIGR02001 family)
MKKMSKTVSILPAATSGTLFVALAGVLTFCSASAAAQGFATSAALGRTNYTLTTSPQDGSLEDRNRAANWTRLGANLPTGLDVNLKNGLYLGAWGAGIRPSTVNRGNETDRAAADAGVDSIYAGYRSEISRKLWVDVGVQRFGALGNRLVATPGLANLGQTESQSEVYGAVTWGLFTAKYARNTTQLQGTVTPVASQYLDLSANFNLGNGYSLSPRLGRQDIPTPVPFGFTDYSLTLGKSFANGLAVSVTALGTNAGQSLFLVHGNDFTSRIGLAAGLKYAF